MPSNTLKNSSKNKPVVKTEEFANILANIYETGYISKRRLIGMSMLKGFITGLFGVLGATIGIAIFLGLLSLFDELPLVGDIVDNVQRTVGD
jgi:hypothetical protein